MRRSNSLGGHKCAVKSKAKRNSDVFSLRWNCPSVGVALRNDWGSEFKSVGTDTAKLHGPRTAAIETMRTRYVFVMKSSFV